MKKISIKISGNNIYMDGGNLTLPEFIRVFAGLTHNLSGLKPEARLILDEDDNMIVVSEEAPPKLPGVPATIVMDLEDGFVVGGDIQYNGESEGQVIRCCKYLYSIYAKKIVAIAEALFGKDEEAQKIWMERVVNDNNI